MAEAMVVHQMSLLFPPLLPSGRGNVCASLIQVGGPRSASLTLTPFIDNPSTLTPGYLPVPVIPSPNPPFSPHACHIWTVYQPIAIFLLTIAVDTLLLLRGNLRIPRLRTMSNARLTHTDLHNSYINIPLFVPVLHIFPRPLLRRRSSRYVDQPRHDRTSHPVSTCHESDEHTNLLLTS
jgi:hypothetical protein